MLWYTYLYGNTMFTNKWDAALFRRGKARGAGKVTEKVLDLIKSLIYSRVKKVLKGVLWKIDQNRSNLWADNFENLTSEISTEILYNGTIIIDYCDLNLKTGML